MQESNPSAANQPPEQGRVDSRGRVRTCVGCRSQEDAEQMVRVLRSPGQSAPDASAADQLAVDLGNKSFGRGAWVHPRISCIEQACKGGFQRAFKASLSIDAAQVVTPLRQAAERRIAALLHGARGSHKLTLGSDATLAAIAEGKAALVLLAADSAAAERGLFSNLFTQGRLRVWGSKAQLGSVFLRDAVAIVGVCDMGFARALVRAVDCAVIPLRSVVSGSMEVR
ncbi:MAG TPA: DUF448 domain-containing protein [Polyangiaceae bacterium]|nr:DUF448 domain-containing protein [Polyangiaceae bacterium]